MDTLNKIDPAKAKALLDSGRAVLIDIRESDEFAREHVTGAHHVPLSGFNPADFSHDRDKVAIFHCASGARTAGAGASGARGRRRAGGAGSPTSAPTGAGRVRRRRGTRRR